MLLAQISDVHVVRRGEALMGTVDTAGYLGRAVARLGAMEERVDAVVVTGDLVDRGTVEEYEHLQELLAPIEVPVYLAMGNHDDRDAFRRVFGAAAYLRDGGKHVQYAVDVGEVRMIVLDTNVPGQPGGRLCEHRRAWLERELAQTTKPVVIAMHHPPFATGIAFMDQLGLDPGDAEALETIVARHGHVARVICGHVHRASSTSFGGTTVSTAPSTAHHVALTLSPTARGGVSYEPPAFALHAWVAPRLVTHHAHIDPFDGPHWF